MEQKLTKRPEGSAESYGLPAELPKLPLQPVKEAVREDSPDEIEAIEALPQNTTQQPITSLKRGAPDDGDVTLGGDEAGQKKRKLGQGNEVIEID